MPEETYARATAKTNMKTSLRRLAAARTLAAKSCWRAVGS